MKLTGKQIKQRHFDKVYKNAPKIECACGCGIKLKSKDKYGRSKQFINGHNGRKYNDPKEHKRVWARKNQGQRTTYRRKNRRLRKRFLILYKGGKCKDCPLKYNGKNGGVFDFHHLKDKEFSICGNMMEKSLEALKKEADKCDLLCSNCHRLKHSEKY